MTIEEKAKAYDEAIKEAFIAYKDEDRYLKATSERIFPELMESDDKNKPNGCIVMEDFSEGNGFYKVNLAYLNEELVEEIEELVKKWNPELKESEDERIRKWILDAVECLYPDSKMKSNARAWLEKQKEQKPVKFDFLNDFGFAENGYDPMNVLMTIKRKWPMVWEKMLYQEQKPVEWGEGDEQKSTDKVEPKFHKGEWIVFNGLTLYVNEVVQGYYRTTSINGIPNSYDWSIDSVARLWTIQEAKDGDVLAYRGEQWIFIYKERKNETLIEYYALASERGLTINDVAFTVLLSCIVPATKEQRDILFSKMKESGYEWDAEKKELKKIEQNPTIKLELDENGEPVLTPFEAELFSMMSEAWQQYVLGKEINIAEIVKEHSADLASLAHNQQPIMWSEEDEHRLKDTIYFLDTAKKHYASTVELDACIDWLKSLRPQNTWKPSDLPHWKKSNLRNGNTTGFNSDYFCHNGYCINYKELFETLPKDD